MNALFAPLLSNSCRKSFFIAIAGYLTTTGLMKLISVLMESPILHAHDPLLEPFTVRQVLFAAAVIEFGVAYYLCSSTTSGNAPWVLLWLTSVFAFYRISLWTIGFHGHCPCLGHLFDWAPALAQWGDRFLLSALVLMALGSGFFILAPYRAPLNLSVS